MANMDFEMIDRRFISDLEIAIEYLQAIGCSEVYIFGSIAHGSSQSQSDIDIAVRGIQPDKFFFVYGELISRLQHDVDLVDLDLQKNFGKSLTELGQLRRVA
jgi:uncharacterized protein